NPNPRILTGIQAVFKERPKIKRNNQQKGLSLNQMKVFRRTAVLQQRNVGHIGALYCPPVIQVATKNRTFGNHRPPHVFLGAVAVVFIHSCSLQF
ncbi:hypothetical protein U3A58_21700, partial [Algoriphagus sp. C2-6-M1]|uniref:hypothetical protein n=1 Tax=Algoriphagus persicinus TaxID=3108754 RepID=UPI002B3C1B5F